MLFDCISLTGEKAGVSVGVILGVGLLVILVIVILFLGHRSVNTKQQYTLTSTHIHIDIGEECPTKQQMQIRCMEILLTMKLAMLQERMYWGKNK